MHVAHLSDPHLTTGTLGGQPAAGLLWTLQRVLALDPRPDCVVVTGDLTDHGQPGEYQAFRELVEDFPLPLHLGLGNHDDRDAALEAFGGSRFLAGGTSTCYVVDYPRASVVMLDSSQPGTAAGRLDGGALGWLAATLDQRPEVPTLICLHHPPIPVGIPLLDSIRLDDSAALASILEPRRQPIKLLAGHVHRTVSARFAGHEVAIAPSTYRQVELVTRPDRPPGYVLDPPGFLLHLLLDTWVSHLLPTQATATYGAVSPGGG
jgi:3',5'-cyclic-AMP phosphodiesterase